MGGRIHPQVLLVSRDRRGRRSHHASRAARVHAPRAPFTAHRRTAVLEVTLEEPEGPSAMRRAPRPPPVPPAEASVARGRARSGPRGHAGPGRRRAGVGRLFVVLPAGGSLRPEILRDGGLGAQPWSIVPAAAVGGVGFFRRRRPRRWTMPQYVAVVAGWRLRPSPASGASALRHRRLASMLSWAVRATRTPPMASAAASAPRLTLTLGVISEMTSSQYPRSPSRARSSSAS